MSDEMKRALEADGDKLRQLTGEDHGPFLMKCDDECPGDDSCGARLICMCGSEMEDHGIGSGHAPVSIHDYYARPWKRAICEKCGKDLGGHVPKDADKITCFKCYTEETM